MLEDMLAYQPGNLLHQRFAELLAADLDDDAQQFYARTAVDLAAVAAATDPGAGAAALQTLLEALAAAPAARAGRWRRLHRQIGGLVARYARDAAPDDKAGPALARLRQFLRENLDLAELPPIDAFEPAAFTAAT